MRGCVSKEYVIDEEEGVGCKAVVVCGVAQPVVTHGTLALHEGL